MKKWMSLLFVLMMFGCTNQTDKSFNKEELKLFIATDLHYFSPDNFQNCTWFEDALLEGDGKMTHLSQEIIDSFVSEALQEKPDYVILTGDLTFNGEKNSHVDLEKSLTPLRDAGICVAVIDGNHDINNIMARKYTNTGYEPVEDTSEDEFKKIYQNDGYQLAVSEDEASLSYRIDLNQKYSLILLDTINKSYFASQDSQISEQTINWLESQLKAITNQNKIPLIAMHHNLAIHHEMLYEGYITDHQETLIDLFKQYQVPLIFSGHSHVQDIEAIEGMYDICTTALSVSPIQYGIVSLNNNQIDYKTKVIDTIDGDENFFIESTKNRYANRYASDFDTELAKKVVDYIAEVNRCYFAGELYENASLLMSDPMYELLSNQEEKNGEIASFLFSVFDELRPQKQLHIDLDY